MKTKSAKRETGSAIILVISILATLVVIVGVAAEYTLNINRNVERGNKLESAIAIADGCLEHNFAHWRQTCRNPATQAPPPSTNQLSALPLPNQAEFPNVPNFTATRNDYDPNSNATVQQCKVVAVDPGWNVDPSQWTPRGNNNSAPPPEVGNGNVTFNYLASAYVTLPASGPNGKVVAKVQRIFREQQDSPFNYALFYVDPLEIHPGAPFNVTGWVHTNSDLYTAHNLLNFAEKATFSGNYSIGFRPGDTSHNGETPQSPTGVKPVWDSQHQPSNIDPTTFDSTDANNTGYHELIEPPVTTGSPDPFAGKRYYDQAGVRILIDEDTNTITMSKSDGTPLDSSSHGNDRKLYDSFNDALSTNPSTNTIQDNRESAQIQLATLDIGKLFSRPGNSGGLKSEGFNGTIYITATKTGGGAKPGIRLINGSVIPQTGVGLTVASANPVYIQGDYNTGADPPSNSGDPTQPQASGYDRQPCSVIADAVNILSNAWLDSNSGTNSAATPTTVNTAIVSGNVTGGPGFVYTGGAENFPRFLENWSGQDFTYYGSMIELYQSQQSVGVWGKGNVYSPPKRRWYFDTNFKLSPPPGSGAFLTYTYIKGRWSLTP